MFFKEMMDGQKESHRIEMENLRKTLRKENDRTILHIEESHKREIAHLNKGMAELKQQLKDSQISEEEKGILARWWQRRNWRKNSERKDILNGRNPKKRQEQKDHMYDGRDDGVS